MNQAVKQINIDFEPGLLEQFPGPQGWMNCVRASVYGCGRPFKQIAAELDLSVSELSRRLSDNPNESISLWLDVFPDLLRATGDLRPLYWLMESFLDDPQAKRERARAQLADLLPQIVRLYEEGK